MLTAEDKAEIKRIIIETRFDLGPADLVGVVARAMEVLGTKDKAMHWLQTPVPALDDRTPVSLLGTRDGVERVMDVLGQIEHGVW